MDTPTAHGGVTGERQALLRLYGPSVPWHERESRPYQVKYAHLLLTQTVLLRYAPTDEEHRVHRVFSSAAPTLPQHRWGRHTLPATYTNTLPLRCITRRNDRPQRCRRGRRHQRRETQCHAARQRQGGGRILPHSRHPRHHIRWVHARRARRERQKRRRGWRWGLLRSALAEHKARRAARVGRHTASHADADADAAEMGRGRGMRRVDVVVRHAGREGRERRDVIGVGASGVRCVRWWGRWEGQQAAGGIHTGRCVCV
mmetsp:Transcript_236/g.762  ORF Transcript_236/g.762 Transcript_236/m.762 type:complete len:258 (+) Transcript_236:1244-2017(+)